MLRFGALRCTVQRFAVGVGCTAAVLQSRAREKSKHAKCILVDEAEWGSGC